MTAAPLKHLLHDDDLAKALRVDVRAGLTDSPKWLTPKWFYDAVGSDLFEEITRLPEYYPTRAEREILADRSAEIAALTEAKTLVELGSGASEKTRHLLGALREQGSLAAFIPLDVSASALAASAAEIVADYPGLQVQGIVGDFTRHLDSIPGHSGRMVAFLGGTIGNLLPDERAELLGDLRGVLEPGEWLLLGTDLVKDPAVLVPAYDDAAGVTAAFNRNVLTVINRELGADFVPADFAHVALWNPQEERIEMRLRATRPMRVRVDELDLDIAFAEGEDLLTEVSSKFRRERVAQELADAGFALRHWWTDQAGLFGVSLAQAT